MRSFRITIEEATDPDSKEFTKATVIQFNSNYKLSEDVPEWIKEEIDKDAVTNYYENGDAVSSLAAKAEDTYDNEMESIGDDESTNA